MTKQPESRLQSRIQKRLKEEVGGYWVKIWGGPFQVAGTPDLLGCVDGCFFAFEVKTKTGRPSQLQLHTLDLIRQQGGCAEIVTSPEEAIEHVTNWLRFRSVSN